MKRKYRLLKSVDFQFLIRKGNKVFTSNFICYWRIDDVIPNVKIGIIIPKKRCKLSCNRKYYKRVFWAINRGALDDLPKIKCVFFYKDAFFERYSRKEISFINLRKEYLDLMKDLERKIAK